MDDQKIIELYWNRNEDALTHTRNKYHRYCYRIAYNLLQNHEEAEEAENDTYLDAWNAIPPHRPSNFPAFLGKITRSIAMDKIRYQNAQKRGNGFESLSFEELQDCIPSNHRVEDYLNASQLAEQISCFLRTLPKTERAIFLYRYWYCEPTASIASELACSNSKVRTSLHRTRQKLKEYLQKEGINL